jgi:hypothetical protein
MRKQKQGTTRFYVLTVLRHIGRSPSSRSTAGAGGPRAERATSYSSYVRPQAHIRKKAQSIPLEKLRVGTSTEYSKFTDVPLPRRNETYEVRTGYVGE